MIEYSSGPYGASLLLRWHGSALAKAFLPGLLSAGVYLAMHYGAYGESVDEEYLNHPYAIGVLVSSVSFLIIFRANYGYQRYWEACTQVHQLMSKWMDFTAYCAVFHLQSEHLRGMRPPSFFDHDELNGLGLTRDRAAPENAFKEDGVRSKFMAETRAERRGEPVDREENIGVHAGAEGAHLCGPPRLDGGWGMVYPDEATGRPTATHYDISRGMGAEQQPDQRGFASTQGGRTPTLFLQELCHLSSLLCAVALTTLRNDMDDVESPLGVYEPGQPWPVADPGHLTPEVKREAYERQRWARNVEYILGVDQTKRSRTIYNAARPMPVIGGVSDNEIAFLQRARGPKAKTQLVWCWLSDFMIREHHAGSMGGVGSPIISRIVQLIGDGMLAYDHARKIMYTPFPFPHAQLSAFFVLMMVVAIPPLMEQYTNNVWLGAVLSFLTVTCLAGLHEVARELENPFRNAPNDVPLCTLLAFYNEALVALLAGFHPDAYWDKAAVLKKGMASRCVGENLDRDNDTPGLVPVSSEVGFEVTLTTQQQTNTEASTSAVPQSVDGNVSLRELREMVKSQASKIKQLQERMQKSGWGHKKCISSRPQTEPSVYAILQ